MSAVTETREKAAQMPEGDVVRLLLEQHARITELFEELTGANGGPALDMDHKKHVFDELRALLVVHETGEELVVRPKTKAAGGEQIADARVAEEKEATKVLAELENLDPESAEFATKVASFAKSVAEHAQHEESEEFPLLLKHYDEAERAKLGARLARAESMAPTHPHPVVASTPVTQRLVGPAAALVDKVRDALAD